MIQRFYNQAVDILGLAAFLVLVPIYVGAQILVKAVVATILHLGDKTEVHNWAIYAALAACICNLPILIGCF